MATGAIMNPQLGRLSYDGSVIAEGIDTLVAADPVETFCLTDLG